MTPGSLLQVITSTDRRGAEIFALDLEHALRSLGHDVRTVALAPGRSPGLDVPTLGTRPLGIPTLRALRRAARNASLVVAHGSTTLPACGLALSGTGVPFVYRNIGDPSYWAATRARRIRVGALLRRAAVVVAVADVAAGTLVQRFGVAHTRITVIPTGVPAARCVPVDADARRRARTQLGLPELATVAAVVGALSPEKDVALAIDAAAASADLHVLVVGDGPERDRLERQAAARAPGRVHFTGLLDDPAPGYSAADVVLLTSRSEGLPATLIEAGLHGLPVVAVDVGYVGEVVVDGVTGVLVTQRGPAGLVAAIERARDRASELGRAARARCLARFELEGVAAQWSALLVPWQRGLSPGSVEP